jgi:hypothetical protein
MITFVIPMRSKKASKNWELVQKLFNRTLRSVYHQKDTNFRVIVGYHDMPELFEAYDNRVEFLQMNYPAPENTEEQMLDKYYKKRMLMKRVNELGGGYTMFVDDDDLISNKIAGYVNEDQNQNGYFVQTGYDHFYWRNKLKISLRFHAACGTCVIFNFRPEDLPSVDLNYVEYKLEEKAYDYVFDYDHKHWVARMSEANRELTALPFKAAFATLNTSENYSRNFKHEINKRTLMRTFFPAFKPTEKIIQEFSIKQG